LKNNNTGIQQRERRAKYFREGAREQKRREKEKMYTPCDATDLGRS
jgi:hypothetical protein